MTIDPAVLAELLKRTTAIRVLGGLVFAAGAALMVSSIAIALPVMAIAVVLWMFAFSLATALSGRYLLRHIASFPIPDADNPRMRFALVLLLQGNDSLSLRKDATTHAITTNSLEIPGSMLPEVLAWVGYFMTDDAEYAAWSRKFRDSLGVTPEAGRDDGRRQGLPE